MLAVLLLPLLGTVSAMGQDATPKAAPGAADPAAKPAAPARVPGWLGARVETVTPEKEAEHGLPIPFGVVIEEIEAGGPADAAGLKRLDVIVRVGTTRIASREDLEAALGKLKPGDTVEISRQRKDEAAARVTARLGEPPRGFVGVNHQTLTAEQAKALGLTGHLATRVTGLVMGGPALQAGLRVDDIILEIDGRPIADADDFTNSVGALPPGRSVRLTVQRGNQRGVLTVVLGRRPAVIEQIPVAAPPQLMLDTGGHTSKIWNVIFTPDGRQLISGGDDKVIRIWDVASGKTVRTIRAESEAGEVGKLYSVALSPDGRWLASGGWLGGSLEESRAVRIHEFSTGRLVRLLKGHQNVVYSVAFSPDGKRLASGSFDATAFVWDLESGKPLARLTGHTDHIYAVRFTPDGANVVTGSLDKTLRLYSVAERPGAPAVGTLVRQMTGHKGSVFRVAVSPDGVIYSGDLEGEIRVWDGRTGLPHDWRRAAGQPGQPPAQGDVGLFGKTQAGIGSLALTSDGRWLLSTPTARYPLIAYVWNTRTGAQLAQYTGHDNIVIGGTISRDDGVAVSAGGIGHQIHHWDLTTGAVRLREDGKPQRWVGTGLPVWGTGISDDGRRVAWGNTWRSHSTLGTNPLEFQLMLPISGQGLGRPERLVVQAQAPGAAGAPPATPAAEAGFLRARLRHGALSLAHRVGGAHGDNTILDILRDGKRIASLERNSSSGFDHRSYSFTPDGRTIVSGGSNGIVHSFDLAAVEAAAATVPEGHLKDDAFTKVAREFVGHEGDVWAATPSADGRLLVTGSSDQTVRIWNLATRELVVTLFHGTDGEWVMWTRQGFYTGSPGGGALVGWQLNNGAEKTADYVRGQQLRDKLNRPDIVERAIVLASADAAANELAPGHDLGQLLRLRPPVLSMSAPEEAAFGRTTLTLVTAPSPMPVRSLTVTVNDRKVEPRIVGAIATEADGGQRRQVEVPLMSGINLVRVVASNDAGDSDPQEARITHNGEGALDKRGTLWVLAVGVDRYPGLPPEWCGKAAKDTCDLALAGKDARVLADAVAREMGPLHEGQPQRLVLVNGAAGSEPTRANILATLSRIEREAQATDTVVVFFAGHGENGPSGRYFFLPTDIRRAAGSAADAGENVLEWSAVQSIYDRIKGRKLMFIDACHAANSNYRRLGEDARVGGYAAFAAARGNQLAEERHDIGHGEFTYAVKTGLEGKAMDPVQKAVTIYRLGTWVTEEVARRTTGRQEPEFFPGLGNFALSRR